MLHEFRNWMVKSGGALLDNLVAAEGAKPGQVGFLETGPTFR
jgi:hypothetical protein